ncbi:hypothetical protein [Latilactobacillus sakei]|uniref:hypothetical protein n=1 Tax=Latilactobacillus sakei TaxID=1599 RepID=UPI00202ECA82|nr:hypothetical protein [Latilactobacillus sakei]MCM1636271.1 hypothetical protein [Latilactobacillus sakei]
MNTLKSFGNINDIELCGKFSTIPTLEERRDPDTGMMFSFVAVRLCVVEGQYVDGIWTEEAKNYFPLRFYQDTEEVLKAEIGDTMLVKGSMVTYSVKANEGGVFTSFYVKVRSHTPLVNEFSQNRKGNSGNFQTNNDTSIVNQLEIDHSDGVVESVTTVSHDIPSDEVVTCAPTIEQNSEIDSFIQQFEPRKSHILSRLGRNKKNTSPNTEALTDGLSTEFNFDVDEVTKYVNNHLGKVNMI